jgi:uncharacterized membrane-anchored protein YjiN (DUF445 family)
MTRSRNRIGSFSLIGALVGFLFVTFQPWLPLDRVLLFNGLSLKGLLSAFFDASLVGALADWFAIAALFRNPLGIRLPHANILAKNKDAIAEAVPRFLTSFVSEQRIAAELGAVDFAGKVEKVIQEGAAREEVNEFLRSRLSTLIAGSSAEAGGSRDQGVRILVREALQLIGEKIDTAAAFASLLGWVRREGYDNRIVEGVTEFLRVQIGMNIARLAGAITPIVKRNAGWQGIFVGQGTVERLLQGVQSELAQVRANPRHELRRFLVETLDGYAARLSGQASDPGGDRDRFRQSVRGFFQSESFQSGCADFLDNLLRRLGADLGSSPSGFVETLTRVEHALEVQFRSNPDFRKGFNRGVASLLTGAITKSRLIEGLTGYLATILKSTDEQEFVRRIEEAVWNDLQYIRVNGAAVGALVGLVLAVMSALLPR